MYGHIAQLVEQDSLKVEVQGSTPCVATMKLKMLKNLIDQASAYAGDADVDAEVCWIDKDGKETAFEIVRVGHFHIVPDVVITVQRIDDYTNQDRG